MRIAASLIIALALSGSGCKDKTPPAPQPPPKVQVVNVVATNIPIYRDWVGTLDSEVNATISAQVTGYLLSRNYTEGRLVTNGQVLFQIDPAPFEAALAQARAGLVEAEAQKQKTALDVERYTPLARVQAVSQQELDDAVQADKAASGQVESAKARVLQAEINLGFTTIRSPVDGVAGLASVTQAQVGNLVGPNSGPLTSVAKIDPIRVYFSVAQQFMIEWQQRELSEGREPRPGTDPNGDGHLELLLASGEVYPHRGSLRFGDNRVDVKTGTIQVVGEFPNPKGVLVPGMFTRVRARIGVETNAIVVPQRAVSDIQGRSLIASVGPEDKVRILPVTPGERYGGLWVIRGDVKAGDRVIAEGIQKVRNGVTVTTEPYLATNRPASLQ
ncbi:MAG: efflux RND transporter periplasmic adaptor subunit [Verrucomicrobiae bacterium]|nr:efflux RND transporter periplasmic adaptor subunit [Verrucomicrobiae bacterium]